MDSFKDILARGQLAARSFADDDGMSTSSITAMIALLCLVFVALSLVGILMVLRRAKKQRQLRERETLPQYEKRTSFESINSLEGVRPFQAQNNNSTHNPRGLTIQTSDSNGRQSMVIFNRDGQPMLSNPHSPPYSPDNVPEIRITFPDEADEMGRPKSGRVVVVRVGDSTIGMEPVVQEEEQLPAYEKESKSQFYSIDMDKIGGLKEKGGRTDYY